MWDYQKESDRIGIRRTSREKDAEKHPGMTALDQSRGKGNSPDAALQRDVSTERIRYLVIERKMF